MKRIVSGLMLILIVLTFSVQLSRASQTIYIPLGEGLPHVYNNIPFEIWGVSLSVYHNVTSKLYEVYDLSGYIANKIHIIQASCWADNVPDNVVVGQIRVYYMDGTFSSLDLICGVNTAEWAYDRPELQLYLQHTKIPPAFSYWCTDSDSYWGHRFYVVIDTDEGKQLSYLELILDPRSYTGQSYYGYSPADWYGISMNAITLELPLETPVGGYSFPIQVQTKAEPVIPYIALIATLTATLTKLRPRTKRKH
jgi:hypothetical protein